MCIEIITVPVTTILHREYPSTIYYLPSGFDDTPWIRVSEDPYEGADLEMITNNEYEADLLRANNLKNKED